MSVATDSAEAIEARASEIARGLFDGTGKDPYPLYDELRELGDGIHWVEQTKAYIVCRYADVRRVASDPSLYSSDLFWDSPQSMHDAADPDQVRFVDVASRIFIRQDPPFHTRVRSSFRKIFTPQAMTRSRPLVEREAAALMANYRPGQELDIMPSLAAQVPVVVIATILGVPKEKHDKFREWSIAFASTFDSMVTGQRRDQVIATSLELMDYLGELVDARHAQPQDDLITRLITTDTTEGDRLTYIESVAQLTLLLAAGNETTTNLIGSGLTLLLEHPEAKAELIENPSLIPGAIEEMLRCDPPLHLMMRKTTQEVELGDHVLPTGTLLMPSPPAANRDPRRFADPTVFDIHRSDNKHLSFFHGIHFCLGAALARLEGAVVFEQLLKNFPDITFGSEPAQRRTANSSVRGWRTRPVRL
jgi:cytochrome P450